MVKFQPCSGISTVLDSVAYNITHEIISIFSFSVEENFKSISIKLRSYFSIILYKITHPRRTQFLNIKLEVVIVLNNTYKPNITIKMLPTKGVINLLIGLFFIL